MAASNWQTCIDQAAAYVANFLDDRFTAEQINASPAIQRCVTELARWLLETQQNPEPSPHLEYRRRRVVDFLEAIRNGNHNLLQDIGRSTGGIWPADGILPMLALPFSSQPRLCNGMTDPSALRMIEHWSIDPWDRGVMGALADRLEEIGEVAAADGVRDCGLTPELEQDAAKIMRGSTSWYELLDVWRPRIAFVFGVHLPSPVRAIILPQVAKFDVQPGNIITLMHAPTMPGERAAMDVAKEVREWLDKQGIEGVLIAVLPEGSSIAVQPRQ